MILQRPLRFGIKTAPLHATHEALMDVWQEADTLPIFEHAWLWETIPLIPAWRAGPYSRLLPPRLGVCASG